jgi:hypothetical protein
MGRSCGYASFREQRHVTAIETENKLSEYDFFSGKAIIKPVETGFVSSQNCNRFQGSCNPL